MFFKLIVLILICKSVTSQIRFARQKTPQCLTKSLGNQPCIFPYKFNNSIEHSCIRNYKNDGRLEGWCPTQVDPVTLEGTNWYECRADILHCPLLQYHNQSQLLNDLSNLINDFPNLAQGFEVGKSVLGRRIAGIRISQGVNQGPRKLLKPMVKLLGNMHGNEPVGRELLLHFAKHLLGSYGLDDRITRFIDNTDLWIVPSVNPDGYARASEGSCEGGGYPEGRYNEGNRDLNRDFPTWYEVNKSNLESGRQTETIHLIRFILNHPFVLSANFHDGAVLVNYPWDDYHSNDTSTWHGLNKSPDHDVFYHLSTTYSFNHLTMRRPDSCTKWGVMQNGVTNGADWYPVIGGMQDFNYLFSNALEVTMELSCCKFPPRKVLLKEWDKNRHALMAYIEQVHMGIKGMVYDVSGRAVPGAIVQVRSQKGLEGKNVTASDRGEFWKLLMPGRSYQVRGIKALKRSDWVDVAVREGVVSVVDLRLI